MKHTWKSELPSILCFAAMLVLLALGWSWAPDRIPVHWNLRGEIDRYGNRVEGLVLLPAIGFVIYGMFRLLPVIDPRRGNYAAFETAYNVIRHGTLVFLTLLYALMLAATRGVNVDMPIAISTMVGFFFVLIGALLPTIRPNWFFGVRTPWTLSSDAAWTRAHRVAGWTLMLAGVAIVGAGWVRTFAALVSVAVIVGVGMLASIWISYVTWRDDPKRKP